MSDYTNIIQEINTNIPDNTDQAITALKVRTTLIDMIDAVDDNMTEAIGEISVPTKTSDLTNDSGFITASALDGYVTESQLTSMSYVTESQLQQAGYATETYVADYVASHSGPIDLSAYVTHDELQLQLSTAAYVDYDSLQSYLSSYVSKDELSQAGYVTQTQLSANSYATTAFVDDAIADAVVELNIPTKTSDLTNDSGFITATSLEPYVTNAELNSASYVTKTELSAAGYVTASIVDGYVTESQLQQAGYATETYVADYVATHSGPIDLSAYVTKDELSQASYVSHAELNSASYVTQSALNNMGYATTTELNTAISGIVVPTKTSDLTNDSGFITSSALSGLATETYVNSQISSAINEIEIPSKTSDLTNDSGFITASDLTPYVTETELSQAGYVTASIVNGYATEQYVNTAVSGLATEQYVNTAVSGLATEQYVDNAVGAITVPTKTSDLTNDSGFITSSALTGLATETYVNSQISSAIADIDIPVIDENLIPNTTATYNLGSLNYLYDTVYTNKLNGPSGGISFRVGNSNKAILGGGDFIPSSNNGLSLGRSSNQWAYTYSANFIENGTNIKDIYTQAYVLTQNQYDGLSQADKEKETIYIISDQQAYMNNELVTETSLDSRGFLTAANFNYDPVTQTLVLNL